MLEARVFQLERDKIHSSDHLVSLRNQDEPLKVAELSAARWYLEFQSSWILDLWLCPLPKKRLSLGCIVYTVTRELDSDCVRSDVWRLEACGSGSQPMQTSSLWLLASHAALGVVSSWERSPGALPTSSSHRVQHG